ncbi:MAG: type VI secretion system baseplate subunit TssF [Cellvibrionaceae bacterium]|nr:type VI secretion system baseplate subunit TssF [Cellvibrionaceae bacterium]
MDDVLLSYYNRELNYIRKMGAEFSEKHPKIAGRLRLDEDIVEDPHVSRLIESFAFLTARIRHSLDDSFPELTEGLMGILYPDYHAPLPSMSIIQFNSLPDASPKNVLTKGEKLKIKTAEEENCYYKTCADVSFLPIAISDAKLHNLSVKAPVLSDNIASSSSVQSILKLKIDPKEDAFNIDVDSFKLYINAQYDIAFNLHEYLLNNVVAIAVAKDACDKSPVFLPKESLKPCGFAEHESMIAFDGRASSAHRLLTEYFLLPQKFLFLQLNSLSAIWSSYEQGFELYIYLNEINVDLIHGVDKKTFLLNCVPVVNLFEGNSEPIQAADMSSDVLLKITDQQTRFADVYQVKEVYALNQKGQRKVVKPFYGDHIGDDADAVYWSLRRENSNWHHGTMSQGTDTYLNFVDMNYNMVSPNSDWVINVAVSCTNRDLPSQLPFGPDQPSVEFMEGGAGLRVRCLMPPTPTVQPKLHQATRWQLIAQLSLQHFCNAEGLSNLKKTLSLYNVNDSKDVYSLINGVVNLETDVITSRIIDKGRSAFCQGTRFVLTCDESFYTGNSLYLFGLVLNEFFSQFCAINTFTQLSIKTTKNRRVKFEWPSRIGCQPLV